MASLVRVYHFEPVLSTVQQRYVSQVGARKVIPKANV